jgi:hypothetical protein
MGNRFTGVTGLPNMLPVGQLMMLETSDGDP